MPIDQLVVAPGEDGKLPFVGKYILLNFPHSELHCEMLKEYGLGFDRVIHLTDLSEEDAGVKIAARHPNVDDVQYNWEEENARANAQLAVVKEFISEDIVKEIDATGTREEVFIKIRTEIDPFFCLADNPDDVRVGADIDLEEDGAKRLPRSDFGDYCPVTFVNDGWLVKGNPEIECTLHGKTFLFAGEKEQEEFKFNPTKFLLAQTGKASLPLQAPAPKIMLCGMKGAGVTT